jgi:putative transposase
MLMLCGQKVFFQASKADLDRLYACNRESARVWNECLRLAKENFLQQGCWITKNELQKQTERKFHLHSQSIQAVCHKYLSARTSRTNPSNKKDGFKVYENEKIELSMGIHHGKKGKPIVVYASHLPNGTIKEIECCFDQGLYLAVTYEDGQKAKAYKPGSSVGVDLGEVHTIGAFCENGQALLITGRKIRSLHRLRNKKLAEILRRQSKCVKKDRADGKRMSGRNDTCCRNQKYSCGMRSIKRPNSLSTNVGSKPPLMCMSETSKECSETREKGHLFF